MGLDMYLSGKKYISKYDPKDATILDSVNSIADLPPGVKGKINTIEFEAGYWRKANHIHDWFVKNVQGGVDECQESYVSREMLKSLLDICQEVLDDPDSAETLLPRCQGFFFGSDEYDKYYFEDVKHTVEVIAPLLSQEYDGWGFFYHSSW
jgi:hypothetical protein